MRLVLQAAALTLLLSAGATPCAASDVGSQARSGEFQLTYPLIEVVGAESAAATASIIAPDEPITWELFVPESYEPDRPAGLMVYISPSPSGEIPRRWKPVMEKRNVIWIAANDSGNEVMVARRAVYALVAPTLAGKHFSIDPERIYLSGFSGGARVGSMVATDYPQVFKGAIYNCGVNFWDERPPRLLEVVRQNHYVFVTGTRDHALAQTRRVHGRYLKSGVENSELVVVRDMTHTQPDGSVFDRAIEYLDSHIRKEDATE